MSNSLNIDVLVSAKNEYTNQLVYLLSPLIYNVLNDIFKESQLKKKKRSISLRNFQILLKEIPNWNNIIVEKYINPIKTNIPYLLDLITAIFISHIKILASVRLKNSDKSIQVKVPNLDLFLHKIIITNAEKIYYKPHIILADKEKIINEIQIIIQDSIRNQIPVDKILNEYLEGVFNKETEIDNSISLKSFEQSNFEKNIDSTEFEKLKEKNSEDDELEDKEFKDDESEDDELEDDESEEDEIEELKQITTSKPIPPTNPINIPNQFSNSKTLFSDAKVNDSDDGSESEAESAAESAADYEAEHEAECDKNLK
jgi:hypothetical protein